MTTADVAWLLVLVAGFDLAVLAWRGLRWHWLQLIQAAMVGAAGGLALAGLQTGACLIAGVTVYSVTRLFPALSLSVSRHLLGQGRWRTAAAWRRGAGLALGGHYRRWYAQIAASLVQLAHGKGKSAAAILEEFAGGDLPRQIQSHARLMQLTVALQRRQWVEAIEVFESTTNWVTAAMMAEANLAVARAYAENDQFDRALAGVENALLSPAAGRFARQLWLTRVRLAAMAGDPAEVKRLLADRDSKRIAHRRFAVYWRGRCALARGDHGPAVKLLSRAYSLTDQRDHGWLDAIGYYLHLAEQEPVVPPLPAADTPAYAAGSEAVRQADRLSADWRNLFTINWREPAPLVVLVGLTACWLWMFLGSVSVRVEWEARFGNVPWAELTGEWWRPLTALFLHDGGVHLFINAVGLVLLGGVVTRVMGWWRFLVLFFAGGYSANLASALVGNFDLAIGASSGVYALLGGGAVLIHAVRVPHYAAARRRTLGLLGLVVAVDFLVATQAVRVDYVAHLGGLISGIVIAAALWLPRQKLGRLPGDGYSSAK